MEPIKTFTAIIKITFEASEKENPSVIAKNIADSYNCMRGANLSSYGTLEKIIEEKSIKFSNLVNPKNR